MKNAVWLIIRETSIKTTVKYPLTPVKWPVSKSRQTIHAGESIGKREPSYTVSGNVNWSASMGNILMVPWKTKNRVTV